MRKNYILTLVLTLFTAFAFAQGPIITAIVDGDCSGGNPKLLEIYADGAVDFSLYSLQNQTNSNTAWDNDQDLSALGIVTDAFVYITTTGSATAIGTEFPSITGSTPLLETNTMNLNGDDRIRIILTSNSSVIDQYGVDGEDGTGENWEYDDSYAKRMDGTGPDGGFTVTNWSIPGFNTLDGLGACKGTGGDTYETLMGGIGTYNPTASSDPSVTITAPSNGQVFDASITEVAITLNVNNFTLSGDAGGGVSDGTGDGYIVGTSTKDGVPDGTPQNIFSLSAGDFTLDPGSSYTLTAELVDNAGNSLSPAVTNTVSFSVELPCDLELGTITTTCDALTSSTDTYNGSIAFTGGNTGIDYTITAPAGVVVAGDDPDNVAAGIITFSGMTEGIDAAVSIVGDAGSSCNYDRTLFSPVCVPFPVYESFDYTVGTDLIASADWQDASTSSTPNNIQVVAATLGNPYGTGMFADPTGAMVNLVGSGSDPYIGFNATSTGMIYASFIFSPTDISTMTDTTDGGYFAVLAESGGSFRARLYIRQTAGDPTRYELGISESSSATNFNTTLSFAPGEETFIVMEYNLDTDEIRVWGNPDPANFEGASAPATQDLYQASGSTAANLGRFILRQDSTGETPNINFDELRIGTTWAQVTPTSATASVGENQIDGFAAYPNPVRDNQLTITSNSTDNKKVELYNVLGRRVYTQNFSDTRRTFDVSGISSGIYILKVTEGNRIATQKLIIE